MARDFARAFYRSKAWRHARETYLRVPVRVLDGRMCPPGMCERCFERGALVPAEIVHHRKHLTPQNIDDPSVALSPSNLMRVCRDCHAALHSSDDYAPRVGFDENGRVVPLG